MGRRGQFNLKGRRYQVFPLCRPCLLLDGCARGVRQWDGKASFERALGFLEEKDIIEDMPQENGTRGVIRLGNGNFDSPILRPANL